MKIRMDQECSRLLEDDLFFRFKIGLTHFGAERFEVGLGELAGDGVEVFAGLPVALIGRLKEQAVGLLAVLLHAVAGVIAGAHVVLGEHMAGGGGFLEPLDGDVVIEIHLHAKRVAPAHFVLGLHVAGLGLGRLLLEVEGRCGFVQ